jgi:hypothetical protein
MKTRIAVLAVLLGVCACCGSSAFAASAPSLNAPDNHSVLILSNSVAGGTNSWEAVEAQAAGFTAVVVTSNQWVSMTRANFATYRALVLGDDQCGGSSVYGAAAANTSVWHAAVSSGNIIMMGTDASYHAEEGNNATGAQTLIRNSIGFAGAQTRKTGLYFAFGCHSGSDVTAVFDTFGPGEFGVANGSYNYCHIVATHPALATLTDADLSLWSTSVHQVFTNYPTDFMALAVAASTSFTNDPPPTGHVYIIAKGQGLVSIDSSNDCSLAAVTSQINELNLTQSRKTALINSVNALHRLAVAIKCHTTIQMGKAITKRMQKSLRLGQVDINTVEDLQNCINQFIGNCSTEINVRAHR